MYINSLGHITKMSTLSIYGKNPSKIFADFKETWPEASMAKVLQYIYKS